MVTRKQRRRRLARAKWERQQQRRAERARRRRRNGILVGTALGVVIALVAGFVIVQLATGDSADGNQTGAPAPSQRRDLDITPLTGDRLPGSVEGSTFQVRSPVTGVVESTGNA